MKEIKGIFFKYFFQIANSGIDLKITKAPGGTQTITVTRREGGRTVSEAVTTVVRASGGGEGGLQGSGAKRPRIDSNYRKQFDSQVSKNIRKYRTRSCKCRL